MLTLLVSAALAAAVDEPIPPPTGPMVTFEVRRIDCAGVEWRDAMVDRIKQVDWIDGVTVWTLEEGELKGFLDGLCGDTRTNMVQAPKVSTWLGASATVIDSKSRNLITHLDRVADGPRYEATAVAFHPNVETVEEGIALTLTATREGDGHRVSLDVREKWLQSIYTAEITDGVKGDPAKGIAPANLSTTQQVAQVVQVAAAGDWAVPAGRHLLVSLGPREREEKGRFRTRKAVWEKLVLITVHEFDGAGQEQTARPLPALPSPVGN